ncbi:hypothetical protein TcasGA2_TC009143 [Tribolium castaneum]|uniref:Essential protein Yae1 N-terminal domain-containing protein n=1 Tax=Tribolium castaneum TaxID=7070 RepID=D6WTT3_TRICA|nr:PREDICTED: uncharacterized protein LOC103313591 [Tribolium castaneum]EFA06277.1 hypothetical protein TcasGA2_TC009143 [Tribolium castaneum]|eukprot:XP_008195464.1 PREDICTED: uncharacterized protein LOC103313591 [Tribolium castaneum]
MSDDEIAGKTWTKIEKNVKRLGLGDGLSNGKDSNFQDYFDKGFADGFSNAYLIGHHKGAFFTRNTPEDPLLAQPKLGWCQICQNDSLVTLPQIKAKQTDICNRNLDELKNKTPIG